MTGFQSAHADGESIRIYFRGDKSLVIDPDELLEVAHVNYREAFGFPEPASLEVPRWRTPREIRLDEEEHAE